jgi:very-short-patch-repair endonuclease
LPFLSVGESQSSPRSRGELEEGDWEGKMRKRWRTTEAIQQRAKELRRNQTPAERKLWARLRGKQLGGLKFRRQHPIGRCIVDFCCLARKLVIEIDGDSHAFQVEYDHARTAYLEERGYTVVRFTNDQVHRQFDDILAEIARRCGENE